MDDNYKRKRKEQRLRERLEELYLARKEMNDTKTWSLRDRSLKKEKVDFWSITAEHNSIDSQILDIEQKLFIRRS